MSLKQRYRFTIAFLLMIFTITCPCLSQARSSSCIRYYIETRSVHFGNLIKGAETQEALESLNKMSSKALQFAIEPRVEEHLINSLIFYKRSLELKIDSTLPKDLYLYILSISEEQLKAHNKFQYFRYYLTEPLN